MQNGGLQLQEFIKSKRHDHVLIQIFTRAELKAATNNYADDMKIGAGGFGAVYKGKLETGQLVAIKKALVHGDGDNKEFVNELIILTQIHHKHIVKLLGCCLETKTPLLVYEYASNERNIGRSLAGNFGCWIHGMGSKAEGGLTICRGIIISTLLSLTTNSTPRCEVNKHIA